MLAQQGAKLIFEWTSAVMFFLVLDVMDHLGHVRLTHGKRGIAVLPMKSSIVGALCLDPFRRARFQFLDHFGNRLDASQQKQGVNMVGRSIEGERWTAEVLEDRSAIGMELGFNRRANPRFAILRAEYKV